MLNIKNILLISLFTINLHSMAQSRSEKEIIADRVVAEKSYYEANTIYQRTTFKR